MFITLTTLTYWWHCKSSNFWCICKSLANNQSIERSWIVLAASLLHRGTHRQIRSRSRLLSCLSQHFIISLLIRLLTQLCIPSLLLSCLTLLLIHCLFSSFCIGIAVSQSLNFRLLYFTCVYCIYGPFILLQVRILLFLFWI